MYSNVTKVKKCCSFKCKICQLVYIYWKFQEREKENKHTEYIKIKKNEYNKNRGITGLMPKIEEFPVGVMPKLEVFPVIAIRVS